MGNEVGKVVPLTFSSSPFTLSFCHLYIFKAITFSVAIIKFSVNCKLILKVESQ